ncbi:MAG: ubiquinol-cytochrome c reductase iron-sulfur subunit [Elusimicrobia bacterium]|nr:ubiquinol-cytochrome c reductase iron-sulfur subunit [Elusimicrobiota bacterium]
MSCCEGGPGRHETPEELSRRAFLSRAAAFFGGLIGAVLTGVGLGYFISPALREKAGAWVDLGRAGNFKPGAPVLVEYTQRKRDSWITSETRSSAWVVTENGRDFTAFDPRCTHLGCPYRWNAQDKKFLCPCHTASFAMDGKVLGGPPPRPLDRYETKLEDGQLLILPQARA